MRLTLRRCIRFLLYVEALAAMIQSIRIYKPEDMQIYCNDVVTPFVVKNYTVHLKYEPKENYSASAEVHFSPEDIIEDNDSTDKGFPSAVPVQTVLDGKRVQSAAS